MRMTKACLRGKVRTVNKLLGYGLEPEFGTVGAIELYGAYGGYGVHRVVNAGHGVSDLMGGCQTAREAGRFLDGMIALLYMQEDEAI